jgi:hypothetical protein
MSSPLNDAASNALRIAGEVSPVSMDHEQLLMRPECALFARITSAAATLAFVENQPGFQWNEGGQTDWETACARLARVIEKRHPARRDILRAVKAKP